ncbi:hypothetical protein BX616_007591 [Lobosporangium transversale]|uniref:Spindle pole body component n=1 Tax=Lobosporangium transversale TaxID=64571 RepID=A0A1Y2G4Y1_9FUNG|nr:gamma-tubulin complex component protein [Lobosporangium transversale]KAF9914773.1 hypothetical protein BX616_007591 [Lobosporangium transversale]ORY93657.1 gamma-tubulin complex component protein [Lobosporangium transversale]|eukprot:XP_021875152.1 gamma-tubulin complex component protein [Lobosporangium transversale]
MLHELLVALSGYPGDIFRPFPPEPEIATTFAITDFALLHPAEREGLDRLAQLGFYFRRFLDFIASCRSPTATSASLRAQLLMQGHAQQQGLYLKALASTLEHRLDSYRQTIIQTETAILSGEDNLGGIVPLSTIISRFAPFELVFPAITSLISEIEDAYSSGSPFIGGRLINHLQNKAASGVPLLKDWMDDLLQGCCGVMMRQIVSWTVYGQIQDPFDEFFIVQLQSSTVPSEAKYNSELGRRSHRSFESLNTRSSELHAANSAPYSTTIKWNKEYVLDESMLPIMIPTTLAHEMLFIGKAIVTAREAKPKPIPIPPSMTSHHRDLILPLVYRTAESKTFNVNHLSHAIHRIRKDIANHLWVVVQVGEKIIKTFESFKRYFLLCNGDFGLGLISALEDFNKNRLSTLEQQHKASFIQTTSTGSIRDHDLGGLLVKAAQGTSAQEDPELLKFELRILKKPTTDQGGNVGDDDGTIDKETQMKTGGNYDDQLLGIPVRLCYSLAWPLDFFLTIDDLNLYSDLFAFLMAVRKTQVKLQQAWMEIKSMEQQRNTRRRGKGIREYSRQLKEIMHAENGDDDAQRYHKESDMLRHIAAMRSDMNFVVDCLWTYLQMDVIAPTYDGLLKRIIALQTGQSESFLSSSSTSLYNAPSFGESQSFDSIYNYHAEALYEIRRASLLTSENLSLSIKNILCGAQIFCEVVRRRAAGQDGFQFGRGKKERDEDVRKDWEELCRLNQVFRANITKLFSDLSAVSRSGSLGDGPILKRSVPGLGSSLLGNGAKSFDVIRQLDQLLLRLEYSKRMWFSNDNKAARDHSNQGNRDQDREG